MLRRMMLALCLLVGAPAQAGPWLQAHSPHFVVYSQDSAAELQAYTVKLERLDATLRMLTGVKDGEKPVPLSVFMVNSMDAAQALMAHPNDGALGFYVATAYGPFVVAGRYDLPSDAIWFNSPDHSADDLLDADNVLFHEYTHHFMLHYFPAAYPRWYVEGFADYIGATRVTDDGTVQLGLPATYRVNGIDEGWVPVSHLLADDATMDHQALALYAEGWLMAHYFNSTPALRHQLAEYLHAISAGKPAAEAATAAFGDLDRLNATLLAYAHRRRLDALQIKGVAMPQGAISVAPLPPAQAALISYEVMQRQPLDDAAQKKLADRLAAAAARFPDDPYALGLLAEAQADAHEYDLADGTADRLLAIRPDDARGLLVKGEAALGRLRAAKNPDPGGWGPARAWMVKANHQAPDDPLILRDYYESFASKDGPPPPLMAQAGLIRAMELVPQDRDLRMLVATDYERRRMYDDAIIAIEPVAYSAHDGGNYRSFLDQLFKERADAAGSGAPSVATPAAPAAPATSATATATAAR